MDGEVRVFEDPPSINGYAFSYERLTFQGGRELKNGSIVYDGAIISRSVVGGRGIHVFGTSSIRDPLWFSATDLVTGRTVMDTLMTINFDSTEGELMWDSATKSFRLESPGTSTFLIDISSPYTVQKGLIDLEVQAGVVTRANATGMFAGLLPAVGTVGPILAALGTLTLDYDFGDFDGHPLDVSLNDDSSGTAFAAVPEPSTLVFAAAILSIALIHKKRRDVKTRNGVCRSGFCVSMI